MHGNRAFAVGSETHDDLGGEEDIDQIEFPTSVLCVHSPYVAFSNIEGGWPSWASGSDNINADPEFVDASAGDFRLVAGSPCIDAGTNIDIPLDVLNISRTSGHMTLPVPDLDHEPRIFGCVADMGAFEWWHAADLNGDHMVNFADLLILLNAWGTCPSPCPEDLDGNGEVNFADMLILLSAWSNACSGSESELGSIEECITRLGLSDPEALAACIEAMIMNDTP